MASLLIVDYSTTREPALREATEYRFQRLRALEAERRTADDDLLWPAPPEPHYLLAAAICWGLALVAGFLWWPF
jgi:hypothetical protein